MSLKNVKIGFALTGAFPMIKPTIELMKKVIEQGATIFPIFSFNAYNINTKFGDTKEFIVEIEKLTGNKIINTFVDAENLKDKIDIMIIAPCTGNTISKLANGITDTPVLMAVKSNFIIGNNLVLGIAANDGLSSNASNIGILLNTKNIYFIPFTQNNPITKPNSLVFNKNYIIKGIEYALKNRQLHPILV